MAGFVDAVGFLITQGYFVSFMSGNSTRLGVGLFQKGGEAVMAGGLIAAFVIGVFMGASLRRVSPRRPELAILTLLAMALGVCGGLAERGLHFPAALLLAVAMGAENTIFAEAGEVRVGLTYMTGALVKIGKGLTATLFGERSKPWVPYLLLWFGLVGGAVLGATAYAKLGGAALWLAAAAITLLALLSLKVFPPPRHSA